MFKMIAFPYNNAVRPVVCEGSHLENTLHYRNTSLRRKAWAHKSKLTATLSTTVSVPNWEIERSCICVYKWITIFASFYDFLLNFGTVAFSCFPLYHHYLDCLYIIDHTPNSYLTLTIICYHSYRKLWIPYNCFDISLELINMCRSKDNVYNLSEILQLKRTLMDYANSTYVKSMSYYM